MECDTQNERTVALFFRQIPFLELSWIFPRGQKSSPTITIVRMKRGRKIGAHALTFIFAGHIRRHLAFNISP